MIIILFKSFRAHKINCINYLHKVLEIPCQPDKIDSHFTFNPFMDKYPKYY